MHVILLSVQVDGKHEAGLGADELSRALNCSVLVAKERYSYVNANASMSSQSTPLAEYSFL